MAYILQWKNPAVDGGKVNITVPVGSVVSNATSLVFTGKGAANYGKHSQENLMRLLENFADTVAPPLPTVGQTWYDSTAGTLKVFTDSSPATWKALGGVQVLDSGAGAPTAPRVGDMWFERTGSLTGYLYVFTGTGRFPYSTTVNGGWSQIWPRVDAAGLRQEYDQVSSLVAALATALPNITGRLFTQLPDTTALDADLQAKRAAAVPADLEFNNTGNSFTSTVQPVSYDWDALLSAARWLVSRLDLPLDSWQDVSSFPFVQDGRQARNYLFTNYNFSEPRATPPERRSSRPLGTITLHRLYAETVNMLSAAQPFRYSLRGIAGASGTNSSFAPDVVTALHCRRAGNWTGASAVAANTLFRWASAGDRDRFIAGGSAIEITVRLVGGSGANNTTLNSFLNSFGRIRVTADYVRWMDASATPIMGIAPTAKGLLNIFDGSFNTPQPFVEASSGSPYNIALSGTTNAVGFNLTVTVNAPAGITGNLQVTYAVIQDKTTYDATELKLYPPPVAYNAGTDATGTTGVLANSALTAPPIANFTANGNTGPSQVTVAINTVVNFVFTGAGSPTLVEWDFDGDGVFTATGTSASHTYTGSAIYSPRVRVTNAGGSDVLFRPGMIRAV